MSEGSAIPGTSVAFVYAWTPGELYICDGKWE